MKFFTCEIFEVILSLELLGNVGKLTIQLSNLTRRLNRKNGRFLCCNELKVAESSVTVGAQRLT